MSELLKMQFDDDREKFVAAMEYGDHTWDLQDIINLAQNLDCYWLYPSVQSEEDYGHYLIEEPVSYTHLQQRQLSRSKRNWLRSAPLTKPQERQRPDFMERIRTTPGSYLGSCR